MEKLHYGIISSPVPGHLNPLSTLGRALKNRGHRVTVFTLIDLQKKIEAEGLEFAAIGEDDFPVGAWEKNWGPLAKSDGIRVLLATIKLHAWLARMMCRDIPGLCRSLGIDALVIDQIQFQGRAIAESVGLPYVSVSCALPMNRDLDGFSPPPFLPWNYPENRFFWQRWMTILAWKIFDRLANPVLLAGNRFAESLGRKGYPNAEKTFSPLAQIIPMARSFDWPARLEKQEKIHYVGAFVDENRPSFDFPWEKLDGRPIVYASFGTLQNHQTRLFELIAEACAPLPVQLVLTLGDWKLDRPIPALPGNPIVVGYAPQLELIKKAAVGITHAGTNTVAESLAYGLPMVGIPIANDQPATAARLARSKAGILIPLARLTASRLRDSVSEILNNPSYREVAQQFKEEIRNAGGVLKAAEVVEKATRGSP